MIKVLLADDEQIIRRGLRHMIRWEALGLELVDTAIDGLDAWQKILEYNPRIVITDIRMPGLNGLQLIKQAREENYLIDFIVLSGYSEFDFARQALQYGVQHYVLKPTDENELSRVLQEVIDKIRAEDEHQQFMLELEQQIDVMKPFVQKQFIRDCLLDVIENKQEKAVCKKIFQIPETPVQILLLQPGEEILFRELLAIERIGNKILKVDTFLISTIIKNMVVFVLQPRAEAELNAKLQAVQHQFYKYMKRNLTIAVSEAGEFAQVPVLYKEACKYLAYKYYLGSGKIITNRDINLKPGIKHENLAVHGMQQVKQAINYGTSREVKTELESWFTELEKHKVGYNHIFSYIIELFLPILRAFDENTSLDYLQRLLSLEHVNTLPKIKNRVISLALEITGRRTDRCDAVYSKLIQSTLQVIDENIGNSDLSLKWIVRYKVFTNPDYLSKLFKKEVGIKFTRYIMHKRIEQAKLLLKTTPKSVNEIALEIGFANNPQYFSKVFKLQTGCTPKSWLES